MLGHGPARRARHPEADAGQPGRRAAGKDAPDRGPSLGRDQARSLEFLLTFKVQRDRGPRPRAGRTRPCGAALSCASRPEVGDHDADIGFPEGNPERCRSCPRSASRSPCCVLDHRLPQRGTAAAAENRHRPHAGGDLARRLNVRYRKRQFPAGAGQSYGDTRLTAEGQQQAGCRWRPREPSREPVGTAGRSCRFSERAPGDFSMRQPTRWPTWMVRTARSRAAIEAFDPTISGPGHLHAFTKLGSVRVTMAALATGRCETAAPRRGSLGAVATRTGPP